MESFIDFNPTDLWISDYIFNILCKKKQKQKNNKNHNRFLLLVDTTESS